MQGRSPTRQAVPKMPRTPSASPFSSRLRRRAINSTPPKRVKAWGDGPLRPEVMYPVVEHTRTNCAARNHSRSRAPHHRTQRNAKNAPYIVAGRKSYWRHVGLAHITTRQHSVSSPLPFPLSPIGNKPFPSQILLGRINFTSFLVFILIFAKILEGTKFFISKFDFMEKNFLIKRWACDDCNKIRFSHMIFSFWSLKTKRLSANRHFVQILISSIAYIKTLGR